MRERSKAEPDSSVPQHTDRSTIRHTSPHCGTAEDPARRLILPIFHFFSSATKFRPSDLSEFVHAVMPATPARSRVKGDKKPYIKPDPATSPPSTPTPNRISSAKTTPSTASPGPYNSSDIDGKTYDAPETKPKSSPKSRAAGKAWTGDEKVQLFRFALERNGRGWDEAVMGRTASQASQTWK